MIGVGSVNEAQRIRLAIGIDGDGYTQLFPELDEELALVVDKLLGRYACRGCGAFELLTVLIRSGEKSHVVAAHAFVARQHIADNRSVR